MLERCMAGKEMNAKLMHVPVSWGFLPSALPEHFVAWGTLSLERVGEIHTSCSWGKV